MLKLPTSNTFVAKVKVSLPTDRPGVPNDGDFNARFTYVPYDDFLGILDAPREMFVDDEMPTTRDMVDYKRTTLEKVLVSVDGLGDESGTAFATERQRELIFEHLGLLNATFDAFIAGYNAAPAKNSKRSPKR